jgi:glutamate-1-semialdehyde 2,1-aminomutase
MTRSEQLFQEAQTMIPGGVNSPVRAFRGVGGTPLFISKGEGPYLFDADGKRYVDLIMSWGPLVLGHAAPSVVEAISSQAMLGTSYGAPTGLETELAQTVQGLMPNLEMLRFVSSGTEATMSALRLARAFTNREKIVKFSGHYHGHADALLVQAGSGVATLGLPDSPGVTRGAAQDTITVPWNNLEAVKKALESDSIATLILEPVVGNMGFVPPMPGFLEGVRELCTAHGTVLIFDEVMTGFRVARGGAQEHFGVTPDLTCLGKVIGGGLPVGCYGGKREIMLNVAPAGKMYQAGTLSGNPLAMSAGLATLRGWTPEAFAVAANAASSIAGGLLEIAGKYGLPLQASSIGTMFGFFFTDQTVVDYDTAKTSDTARYAKFFHACLERGVYFAPSQFEAGFTSSAHTPEINAQVLAVIEDVMQTL